MVSKRERTVDMKKIVQKITYIFVKNITHEYKKSLEGEKKKKKNK